MINQIYEDNNSYKFMAYCRDPLNEKWYQYNDTIINEVKNFEKEILNYKPYLLFYQR